MEHIDISREIQTIRLLLPQKTTEYEKDALVFSKIFKRINKYNEVSISKFDEINKMIKNVYNILISEENYQQRQIDADILDQPDEKFAKNMLPTEHTQKMIIDDIHIYIGEIDKKWFVHTQKKFYLMDHESFKSKFITDMKEIDGVLCRTKLDLNLAEKIKEENKLEFKIYNTRFTSVFQEKPVLKHWNVVLHFSGEYNRKQTGKILRTWQIYHDLPLIVVVCTEQCYKNVENILETYGRPKNVYFHKRKLENEDFTLIANKMGIHLCPSEIEAYGHTINDARKIRSLIITSNIEPLTELVDDTCAIMIDCTLHEIVKNQKNSKTNFDLCILSEESIYEAVTKAIKMNIDDRKKMTDIAYEKYLEDTYFFEMAMMDLLNDSKPTY